MAGTDQTADTAADEQVSATTAERFQQAWSAMADDLDGCAGTSFR